MITPDQLNVTAPAPKPPMPKDVYQFAVENIESKDRPTFDDKSVTERVLEFTFVCLDEGEFYGRKIWKTATQKLSGGKKPSGLYTVLTGITGKEFTQQECTDAAKTVSADFLNGLIGKQVRLSLGQKVSETTGKTNNVIESYLPVKKQLPAFDEKKMTKATPASDDGVPPFMKS